MDVAITEARTDTGPAQTILPPPAPEPAAEARRHQAPLSAATQPGTAACRAPLASRRRTARQQALRNHRRPRCRRCGPMLHAPSGTQHRQKPHQLPLVAKNHQSELITRKPYYWPFTSISISGALPLLVNADMPPLPPWLNPTCRPVVSVACRDAAIRPASTTAAVPTRFSPRWRRLSSDRPERRASCPG
jgi:hypothetical protein